MSKRDAAGRGEDPGHLFVIRAFRLAAGGGTQCRPVHLLYALAESDGPIGAALRAVRLEDTGGRSGGARSTVVFGQTQDAATDFAALRGEPLLAAHLLVALLDQGDVETAGVLASAGIDSDALRRTALSALGAPVDLAPIPMPPLTPAGTLNRPALDVADLDPRAWRVLSWRQKHLPLGRVRRASDASALSALEQRAAWRIADRAGVDDDQRYSLLSQHRLAVEHRLAQSRPGLVEPRPSHHGGGGWHEGGISYGRRRRRLPSFMVGWPTWFGNRRVGLRDRWFAFATRSAYREQPQLDTG